LVYLDVQAGWEYTLALRSDGEVLAWGDTTWGKTIVPALPTGLRYVQIATRHNHALARRSDGTVVAWGWNFGRQCNVPALPPGQTYVDIWAGGAPQHGAAQRWHLGGLGPQRRRSV